MDGKSNLDGYDIDAFKENAIYVDAIQQEVEIIDQDRAMEDVQYVSSVSIKNVGERMIPCLRLTTFEGLDQWIALDGHVNIDFADMNTCIECVAPLDKVDRNENNFQDNDRIYCDNCLKHHLHHACARCEHRHLLNFQNPLDIRCHYFEETRQPDEWWPRCLSDHAIVLVVHDDFTTITWNIVLKSEAKAVASLLGGSCRAIFGNEGVILDLKNAMAIVVNLSSFFQDMFNNANHNPNVRFIPEWQFSLQQRISEFSGYNARTCKDGGLWLVGLACLEDQAKIRAGSNGDDFRVKLMVGNFQEISFLSSIFFQIMNHVRLANFTDFNLLGMEALDTEYLPSPSISTILPDHEPGIHGIVVGHHGSIVIVQRGKNYYGNDLRCFVGTQPLVAFRSGELSDANGKGSVHEEDPLIPYSSDNLEKPFAT